MSLKENICGGCNLSFLFMKALVFSVIACSYFTFSIKNSSLLCNNIVYKA